MALQFRSTEPVPDGIRRMAGELLDSAHVRMVRMRKPDKDIHEIRLSIKKMRSLLRLARRNLGQPCYRRENEFYRELGKRLSPLREAFVRSRTLLAMDSRYQQELAGINLEPLFRSLRTRHEDELSALLSDHTLRSDLLERLSLARAGVLHWRLDSDPEGPLFGLLKVYRRGRRELSAARINPTNQVLHDWRKRVKYLWYHTQILSPCWLPVMSGQAEALNQLGELLGDDHDLADFEIELTSDNEFPLTGERLTALLAQLRRDRQRLQAQAFGLAERAYFERPGVFAERLAAYWTPWRHP
jgi:CHAD domain-containing protein